MIIATPAANIGFQQVNVLPAGPSPIGIAVGDFNEDGKPDIAAVNNVVAGIVTVLLGNGNGSFRWGSTTAVGGDPECVAVGDFNEDGHLDMAVTNSADNTVSILLGDGKGNFTVASSPGTGSDPFGIAAGDFNNDGHLDIAVVNYSGVGGGDTVSILLGDGTGNFTLGSSPSVVRNPSSIAVGDFNGDGSLDLAVTYTNNFNGAVSILLGDGTGNFSAAADVPTGFSPRSIVTCDFNGDGLLDLAVANWGGPGVSIFLGDGTGHFALASSPVIYEPYSLAAGDFDGDGIPDLAVGIFHGSKGRISILRGDGTGKFQTVTSSATNGVDSLAVGDFDRNGRLDVAAAAGAITLILLQGPAGKLSPTRLKFGRQMDGTTSPPQTVTIANVGYTAMDITSVTIIGRTPQFFSVSNNCPSSLPVGARCTASVTFTPTGSGEENAAMIVTGTGGFNPFSVALTGIGLSVVLNPTSLNFGSVVVGQTSAPQQVVLTNIGTNTLDITSTGITGQDKQDFAQTNNCPKHLAAGGTCTFTVTFTPSAAGPRKATVNVYDSSGDSPQRIPVSGTGT